MPNYTVSFRILESTKDELARRAALKGKGLSVYIRELIEASLEEGSSQSACSSQAHLEIKADMHAQRDSLGKGLEALGVLMAELAKPRAPLEVEELLRNFQAFVEREVRVRHA